MSEAEFILFTYLCHNGYNCEHHILSETQKREREREREEKREKGKKADPF